MILDFEPGDKVVNPKQKDWGIGQVQSIICLLYTSDAADDW